MIKYSNLSKSSEIPPPLSSLREVVKDVVDVSREFHLDVQGSPPIFPIKEVKRTDRKLIINGDMERDTKDSDNLFWRREKWRRKSRVEAGTMPSGVSCIGPSLRSFKFIRRMKEFEKESKE
jgi:hypothetical protein